MTIKYSPEKPKRCSQCYFWSAQEKRCIKEKCHYILPERKTATMCNGCPYGRVTPCIGWCTIEILYGKV